MRKRSRQGAGFTKLTSVILRIGRDDGKRFVVQADEKLTAFVELESAIRAAERPEDCGGRERNP
jgi:hypothetical protein